MPTYDYRCEGCEHEFETFQSITAAPLKRCPQCRKAKLRRLIGTGAAVLFKGDGFYITDYRSEQYKNAAKAETAPADAAPKPEASSKPDAAKSDAAKPAEGPAKAESRGDAAKPVRPAPSAAKPHKEPARRRRR